MTDERALLLAVADAARVVIGPHNLGRTIVGWQTLDSALTTLSAYRAQPKGDEAKTVEVRAVVLMSPCGKYWTISGADSWDDAEAERMADEYARAKEVRAAVIVAHVKPPTTPVVTGSVET